MNSPSNVMIFGGSGIIGGAVATAFGRRGWTVGIHYHQHRSAAQNIAMTIEKSGGKGFLYQADVASASQVSNILQDFIHSHKFLNVLVWAVGMSSPALVMKTCAEDWNRTLQTNLTGAYHVLHAIGPIFEQQKEGSVILVGSLSGQQGYKGQAAYAASKAGLIGLMRTVAHEWGSFNIRINIIFPGWHLSPLSTSGFPSALKSHTHTLHRSPSLESVAASVYHLALSPDVSGQVWNLDNRIW